MKFTAHDFSAAGIVLVDIVYNLEPNRSACANRQSQCRLAIQAFALLTALHICQIHVGSGHCTLRCLPAAL